MVMKLRREIVRECVGRTLLSDAVAVDFRLQRSKSNRHVYWKPGQSVELHVFQLLFVHPEIMSEFVQHGLPHFMANLRVG